MIRKDITNFSRISDEPRGYNVKYWIFDGKEKLIKYNSPTNPDADVMEKLAGDILKYFNINTIEVSLGKNNDPEALDKLGVDDGNCVIIDTFLEDEADVAINLLHNRWPKVKTADVQKNISSCFYKMFNIFTNLMNISEEELEMLKRNYIRMVFGDCLIDNEDRRLKNIEVIYNEKNFTYRLAPSFDNALAFNAYNIGAKQGYCYVGNQAFDVNDLITYILNHYYDEVKDIIKALNSLDDSDIIRFLDNYSDMLVPEKITFIFKYLTEMREFINTFDYRKTSKR